MKSLSLKCFIRYLSLSIWIVCLKQLSSSSSGSFGGGHGGGGASSSFKIGYSFEEVD